MTQGTQFTYWGVDCPQKGCFVPLWKGETNESHFDVWPQNVTCPECKANFNVNAPDEPYRRRSIKPVRPLWNPEV